MIRKQLLLSLLVIAFHIQTGIYVLAELPKEVAGIIQEAQDVLSKKIAIINERDDGSYIFQNTQFSPHLSLAFVSQEELPIQEVKQKFVGLIEELQQIAGKHGSINLSQNFADAAIDYWPGKFEVECAGSKKKNYLNVVLKASNNLAFANLAQDVSKALEEKHNVKQRFPFSTHITLGRICDREDKPIDTITLQKQLENILIMDNTATKTSNQKLSITLTEFKLKGHDGSEEIFTLS